MFGLFDFELIMTLLDSSPNFLSSEPVYRWLALSMISGMLMFLP